MEKRETGASKYLTIFLTFVHSRWINTTQNQGAQKMSGKSAKYFFQISGNGTSTT